LVVDPTGLDSRYVNVTGDTMTGSLDTAALLIGGTEVINSSREALNLTKLTVEGNAYINGSLRTENIYRYGANLQIQYDANQDVLFFKGASSGENPVVWIYGYDSGAAAKKYGYLQVAGDGTFVINCQAGEQLKLGEDASATHLNYNAEGDVVLFRGAAAGENRSLYIYGDDGGVVKYGRLVVDSSGNFTLRAQEVLYLLSESEYLHLRAAAGKDMLLDCGGTLKLRDVDDANAVRLTVDSATGDVNVGGDLTVGGGDLTLGSTGLSEAQLGNLKTYAAQESPTTRHTHSHADLTGVTVGQHHHVINTVCVLPGEDSQTGTDYKEVGRFAYKPYSGKLAYYKGVAWLKSSNAGGWAIMKVQSLTEAGAVIDETPTVYHDDVLYLWKETGWKEVPSAARGFRVLVRHGSSGQTAYIQGASVVLASAQL